MRIDPLLALWGIILLTLAFLALPASAALAPGTPLKIVAVCQAPEHFHPARDAFLRGDREASKAAFRAQVEAGNCAFLPRPVPGYYERSIEAVQVPGKPVAYDIASALIPQGEGEALRVYVAGLFPVEPSI